MQWKKFLKTNIWVFFFKYSHFIFYYFPLSSLLRIMIFCWPSWIFLGLNQLSLLFWMSLICTATFCFCRLFEDCNQLLFGLHCTFSSYWFTCSVVYKWSLQMQFLWFLRCGFFFFFSLQLSDAPAFLTPHSQHLGPLAARICLGTVNYISLL